METGHGINSDLPHVTVDNNSRINVFAILSVDTSNSGKQTVELLADCYLDVNLAVAEARDLAEDLLADDTEYQKLSQQVEDYIWRIEQADVENRIVEANRRLQEFVKSNLKVIFNPNYRDLQRHYGVKVELPDSLMAIAAPNHSLTVYAVYRLAVK